MRAAKVGGQALDEADPDRMLKLLHQALSWIQLAENEESLAEVAGTVKEDRPH